MKRKPVRSSRPRPRAYKVAAQPLVVICGAREGCALTVTEAREFAAEIIEQADEAEKWDFDR